MYCGTCKYFKVLFLLSAAPVAGSLSVNCLLDWKMVCENSLRAWWKLSSSIKDLCLFLLLTRVSYFGIMEIKLLPVLSWTRGVSDTGEIIKADTMSCMGSPLDTH